MNDADQTELIARAKTGDLAAFEGALSPHLPMLFAYSRAICGDYHAAQDVVQETAVIALRKLDCFFAESDFGAWLRAIARHRALHARHKLNRPPLALEDFVEEYYARADLAVDEEARMAAVQACLEQASERMRRVVNGHYLEGRPLAALAPDLAISVNAAKQLLYRARLFLQECVRRRLQSAEGAS